jgi:hypothetical protein
MDTERVLPLALKSFRLRDPCLQLIMTGFVGKKIEIPSVRPGWEASKMLMQSTSRSFES